MIEDESVPDVGMRQMVHGELIPLSAQTALLAGAGMSPANPLGKEHVLDLTELNAIREATDDFNNYLKQLAQEKGLAFVDANTIMNDIIQGVMIDGSGYSADFITGSVFSLDGIHACGKGSAIIANAFIEAINEKFDATVPLANVNDYPGIAFP